MNRQTIVSAGFSILLKLVCLFVVVMLFIVNRI